MVHRGSDSPRVTRMPAWGCYDRTLRMTPDPTIPDDNAPPPSAIELGGGVWLPRDAARFSFSRASGPGGQNVNKVNTRAELRVVLAELRGLPSDALGRLRAMAGRRLLADDTLVLVGSATRSQLDNREECIARLRTMVEQALVKPIPRRKTKPTRGSKERRLKAKRMSSERKANRRDRGGEE